MFGMSSTENKGHRFSEAHNKKGNALDIAHRRKDFYLRWSAVSLLATIGSVALMTFHRMKRNQVVTIGLGMFAFTAILFKKHRYWLHQSHHAFDRLGVKRGSRTSTTSLADNNPPRNENIELIPMGNARTQQTAKAKQEIVEAANAKDQSVAKAEAELIDKWVKILTTTPSSYEETRKGRLQITKRQRNIRILQIISPILLAAAGFLKLIPITLAVSGCTLVLFSVFLIRNKKLPDLVPPKSVVGCHARLTIEKLGKIKERTLFTMTRIARDTAKRDLTEAELVRIFEYHQTPKENKGKLWIEILESLQAKK